MNIWLTFHPGSAATTIEYILRAYTDLPTLDAPADPLKPTNDIATSAHGLQKQWTPCTKDEYNAGPTRQAECNIYTPIFPMPDMHGYEIMERIAKDATDDDFVFYLGPTSPASLEFTLTTNQKARILKPLDGRTPFEAYLEDYLLQSRSVKKWNGDAESILDLDQWELREYLSLNVPSWYFSEMLNTYAEAAHKGFTCFDTVEIFGNLELVIRQIIDQIGCKIIDEAGMVETIQKWVDGQSSIHHQYADYQCYKDAIMNNHDVDIKLHNVLHEALIQYHLRFKGIELKCYGLNDFPSNTADLRKLYV